MSERCACGSYAINEHLYDRQKGHNSHLCDMCYWQHEARQAHRQGWEQCKREAIAALIDIPKTDVPSFDAIAAMEYKGEGK